MKKNHLLLILISFLLQQFLTGQSRPNIIFILADDYGYMDMQAYAKHTLGTDKDKMY